MELLAAKILPIANDHDLLVHLPLFSFPEVATLTKELADLYLAARKKPNGWRARQIAELVWQSIQEHAAFSRIDSSGAPHLAVIGGYVHQFSWRWARPSASRRLGPIIHSHLFSFPLEESFGSGSLGELYDTLRSEISGHSPSREALALHSLLTVEMELPSATWAAADAESKKFAKLVDDHLVPAVTAGNIREGMDALALGVTKSGSKFVRALLDHDQSIRFWRIHLEYVRSLLKL